MFIIGAAWKWWAVDDWVVADLAEAGKTHHFTLLQVKI